MLTLGSLTRGRHSVFNFHESADTARDTLFDGLLDGSYTKPFVIEDAHYRSLCFALDGCTQSEMRLDSPDELVNEYTRKMMGFLAFQPRPQRLLMIGLGGGSLVKYCHNNLPTTEIIAVEINPDVIALRSQFLIPSDDERLKVIEADGAHYLATMAAKEQAVNAILVDAYDHTGIAYAVVEPSFMANAKRVLGKDGVFVMNIVAEVSECKRYVDIVRAVFGPSVIAIETTLGENLLVFASQTLDDPERLHGAIRNAEYFERRLGLFFPTLIRRLTERSQAMFARST